MSLRSPLRYFACPWAMLSRARNRSFTVTSHRCLERNAHSSAWVLKPPVELPTGGLRQWRFVASLPRDNR